MADKQISQLTEATVINDEDLFVISQNGVAKKAPASLLGGGGSSGSSIYYGECSTAASTQAKTVSIEGITELTASLLVFIKFSNAQSYNGAPTLNVNSLGAVNIQNVSGTNAAQYEWNAGEIVSLVYDGSSWVIVDGQHATTTYYGLTRLTSSETSTTETMAATPKLANLKLSKTTFSSKVFSGTATSAVTAGELFVNSNVICRATTDIASGATITVGTNCESVTISSLLGEVAPVRQSVTLAVASWSDNAQTAIVTGVLADETKQMIDIVPASTSKDAYINSGIWADSQAADSITFKCAVTPTEAITVYVTITGVK